MTTPSKPCDWQERAKLEISGNCIHTYGCSPENDKRHAECDKFGGNLVGGGRCQCEHHGRASDAE